MQNTWKSLERNKPLLRYYYKEILGSRVPAEDVERTNKTIEYLRDCGFRVVEILRELSRQNVAAVTIDTLHDDMWKNSLIKRKAFYLHNELTIISPPPIYDFESDTIKTCDYYYEIKIRYTADDVLKYFYKQVDSISLKFVEKAASLGTIKHMMKIYSNIDYVEPLDIILCCIDRHMKKNPDCYNLIDVKAEARDVVEELQSHMLQLDAKNLREITWR